uniref:LITAF domain-containing protein n=1 Tax=Clastoptera arizonana TaxID=38151 RepID=A0A1B6C017_9HEMI
MSKNIQAPYFQYGPPIAAPRTTGGVLPSSPFTPNSITKNEPYIVTTVVPLGTQPTHMICPHCYAEVNTVTKTKPKIIAYLSGIVIALLGCFWGCCLIPCCLDQCMNVHHICPECQYFLGSYRG